MLRSPVASTAAPGRCRPRREVSPGRRVCSGTRRSSRRTGRGAERSARSPQGCRLPCGSRSAASPPAPGRPQAGRSSERFQRSQHILQQRWIDPSGYPHPGSRELDLDRRCPSNVALFRHHHRDEIERRRPPRFRRSVCRLAQLLAPRIELVAMQPVAARDRTRHRVRNQALGDDLRLLLPAPPPPPLRPRQHLAAARALPTNWQLTWQTIHLRLPLRETPSSARRHRLQRAVKASLTAHRVFANLKTWALGVYHGLRRKHLRSYLDEFVFRFNRRHTRCATFRSLLRIAIARKPATYNMLIAPEAKA